MDYSKLNFLLNGIARSSHLLTKKAACVYLMRKNLGYKDELQVFLYKRVATMIELIESNESLMSLIKQGSDSDIEYFSLNYIPNSFYNEPWNFIKKYVLKFVDPNVFNIGQCFIFIFNNLFFSLINC